MDQSSMLKDQRLLTLEPYHRGHRIFILQTDNNSISSQDGVQMPFTPQTPTTTLRPPTLRSHLPEIPLSTSTTPTHDLVQHHPSSNHRNRPRIRRSTPLRTSRLPSSPTRKSRIPPLRTKTLYPVLCSGPFAPDLFFSYRYVVFRGL